MMVVPDSSFLPRARRGLVEWFAHDHVLRNQIVGSRCSGAAAQRRSFRSPVRRGDADKQVFRRRFGALDFHIEVTVVVKNARVEQFEFGVKLVAKPVFFHEYSIRERCLRILVQVLQVGMGWSAVEIEVIFFGVLAVVPFVARESEDPFLQEGVLPVL